MSSFSNAGASPSIPRIVPEIGRFERDPSTRWAVS